MKILQWLFKREKQPAKSRSVDNDNLEDYMDGYEAFLKAQSLVRQHSKDSDTILKLLDKAINAKVNQAYAQRGFSLQLLGFPYDAIDDFTNAIAFYPKDSLSYYGRGISKSTICDFDGAILDSKHALELIKTPSKELDELNQHSDSANTPRPSQLYLSQLDICLMRKKSFDDYPEIRERWLGKVQEIKRRSD